LNQRLVEMLVSMRPPTVLVVGDVILDVYERGVIERISPEAPAQVLEVTQEERFLGGAANVAANVAALGANVRLVGLVGRDEGAKTLRELLRKRGIPASGLVTDPSRPTTTKTRFMAMRQQMLRVDRERRDEADGPVAAKLLANVEKYLSECDGVIISDYGKGALTKQLLASIMSLAKKSGKMAIVDPKGRDYAKYAGATLITPNRKEAALAADVEIRGEADYHKAAAELFRITGAKNVLITRGDEGMTVFHRGGRSAHLPAEALEVFDVTGAGDTVIAALGVILFSGHSLEDAAKVANAAAAIEVGHLGVRAVTKDEVLARLAPVSGGSAKNMTRKDAAMFAGNMKKQGKTVVFTNGCFDIIHAGHVEYLARAKSLGDALIVGLNTDSSVRRLKGAGRPVTEQDDRARVLSALSSVDAVALFNEETPLNLIKEVKPDILVKGGDYTRDTVVGADIVESYGGRVQIIPLVKGKSTTGIISEIKKRHKAN
jgi:D-beta-D-heptose 7-phosphate kinase/D-beta-D-heptose 1-phosphate adenosyltransferase